MTATIIVLALFGIVMLCLEVVLPGGVLGVIGGGLVLASIGLIFVAEDMQQLSLGLRMLFALAIVAVTAATFILWMRHFHRTFLGRKLILNDTAGNISDEELRSVEKDLTGQEGIAKSDLRPGGTVLVEGQRLEAKSLTGLISRDTPVRVRGKEGTILIVSAIETPENASSDSP